MATVKRALTVALGQQALDTGQALVHRAMAGRGDSQLLARVEDPFAGAAPVIVARP